MKKVQSITSIIFITVIVVATIGGIYFGLFSCGGYIWHRQAFYIAFALVLSAFFIFPPPMLKKIPLRFIIITSIIAFFLVVRASASAFYPSAPASWPEFFKRLILGLKYGPC